ncbi:MAG: rubredoxin [Elusimicrobiota bacterium]
MNPEAFTKINYGMYVVSSKKEEPGQPARFNGQVANTVFQVTAEPPAMAVCINKKNLTHEYIRSSRVFSVSILDKETPLKFIGQFGFKSGREIDKFRDINFKTGITGAPVVLENSIGYLELELIDSIDVGTHTIFFGKTVAAEIIKEGEPMTYTCYHDIKNGKTPQTAPTYIRRGSEAQVSKSQVSKKTTDKEERMDKYKCKVCGYIYEPEKGDPEAGIKSGTSFDDLPDDWVCPVCGVGKDEFEKASE